VSDLRDLIEENYRFLFQTRCKPNFYIYRDYTTVCERLRERSLFHLLFFHNVIGVKAFLELERRVEQRESHEIIVKYFLQTLRDDECHDDYLRTTATAKDRFLKALAESNHRDILKHPAFAKAYRKSKKRKLRYLPITEKKRCSTRDQTIDALRTIALNDEIDALHAFYHPVNESSTSSSSSS